MKKKGMTETDPEFGWFRKLFLIMRLSFVIVLCSLIQVSASTYSQNTRLNIKLENASIKEVFKKIKQQSEFTFVYNVDDVENLEVLDCDFSGSTVEEILNYCLKDTEMSYEVRDRVIIIVPSEEETLIVPELKEDSEQQPQKKKITGKVSDENGELLPGVSVIVKGTTIGTATDIDGSYSLSVNDEVTTLVFSYIGYVTRELNIGNKSTHNVVMQTEITGLSEVVVTALGIERETKALGYAVATVNSKEVTQSNESNVLDALQGKVPGLNISSTTGSSNGSSRIVLRGNSSISGNNQALIVVDGAIYDNTTYGLGNGAFDRSQGISDINPNDIESVSVLKGPNAAALYGSKAANGVLVITTKKALKKKGIGVSVNTGVTLIDTYIFPKLQDVYGQGKAAVGAFDGMGDDGIPILGGGTQDESWGPKMEGQQVRIGWLRDKPLSTYDPQPNNITDQFRTAVTYKNNVAVSSSDDKGSYYASIFHDRTDDFLPTSTSEKTGTSISISRELSKKLSLDAKMNYIRSKSHNRPSNDFTENVAFMPRSVKIEDVKDKYEYSGLDWGNEQFQDGRPKLWSTTPNIQSPFWSIYENSNDDERQKFVGNVNLKYKFTDWLSFKFGYNLNETNYNFKNVIALYSRGSASGGRYYEQNGNIAISTSDFLFSANKSYLDGNLTVSANVGGNQFRNKSRLSRFSGTDFIVPGIETANNTKTHRTYNTESDKVINSLYGFGQVGYKGIVYLDITARNDWSSTLSKGNNSYFYPSVTSSFVFSELMDVDKKIFSFGKFRASWAEVGNDTDPYVINRSYGLSTGSKGDSYVSNPGRVPFEDLQPEKTRSLEFGLDLRFLDGRINLDATYYKSNTLNQILPSQPLAISSGYSSKLVNAGNVQNKGVELALLTTPVRAKDFTWQFNVLFAKNKSQVIDLGDLGDSPIVLGSSELGRVVAKVGQPFGMIQGREFLRNTDGVIVVKESGRPISTNDYMDLAKVEPDWTGTIRNSVSYKGFSLGAQLDVSIGGNILAEINPWLDEQGHSERSLIGREGWMASEEARAAAGYPSDWLPTGGVDIFVGNSVIRDASLDNEDGVQVGGVKNEGENARYADPRKIWDDFLGRKGGAAEYNIEDASFVKLRELSFSYRLPESLVSKTPFQSIQISAVGRNLWLIHRNTTHFDPDQYQQNNTLGSVGIANRLWPSTRSFGFNLNVKF